MKSLLLGFIAIFLTAVTVMAGNTVFYDYSVPYLEAGSTVAYLPAGSTVVYTTELASAPVNTYQVYACDTGGKPMKLASGTTLASTDLFYLPVNACQMFNLTSPILAGTQLNIKSGATTFSGAPVSGYNTLSFFP